MQFAKFLFVALLPLFTACSSSKIINTWKASDYTPKTFQKLMVVGLVRDEERSLREKMENHLVGDLKDKGYNAVSSYSVYGPKFFENMNEEEAVNKLRESGVDAVLTIVLLDKSRERYYVPGRIYYSPFAVYRNRFWGYSTILYDRIYSPGYYQTNTKFFWESNLYDMVLGQLVYSSQTESFDPVSAESLGHEYGLLIVNDLVKNNILPLR